MDSKIAGCVFGMALGDALGAETEFLDVQSILRRFPPNGPQSPFGNPALVTDDTQMAMAVGEALLKAPKPFNPLSLGRELEHAFIAWYHSPQNNRAPGITCLESVEHLIAGQPWAKATSISSKGYGANMRVMPVGLLSLDEPTRAAIAQFQAAITHAHPTGLAASDLTAWVVAELHHQTAPDDLLSKLKDYATSQREVYYEAWLGDLWERNIVLPSPQAFMAYGWDECLVMIEKVAQAIPKNDQETDPCLQIGAGWVAEQAFATALFCFLLFPDDPVKVMQRAALSSGDSDSIACIAGAFAGVYNGLEALPQDWIERIEDRQRLQELALGLDMLHAV